MLKQKTIAIFKNPNQQNFLIYGIGQAFNLLSPLIITPLVVFICKEDGLGKVGLGFALSLFLILIVDYAFDIKGTKQVAENRKNIALIEKILSLTILTKFFLFLITFFIALSLIVFIPFFNNEKSLFFLSLTIVFAQIFNPVWFLQGLENFKLVSVLNIGSKTLYVLLVYFLINKKQDYIYVNLFLGLSSFIFNIIGLLIIKYKYNFKIVCPSFIEIENIIKTDFSFCLSQLSLSVRQLSPLVLTSFLLGFTIAGQYKIIEQIITLFRTFCQVFLKFFYPKICYIYKTSIKEALLFWKKYTTIQFLFICFILIVILIFSENILMYFHLTKNTVQEINKIFRLSIFIPFLMALTLPLEQLMFVSNNNKSYIKITFAVTLLNILLLMVLIKSFVLLGVVLSIIISEIVFIILYSKSVLIKLSNKKR